MTWPVHTLVLDLDDTLFPEQQFVLSGFFAVDEWLVKTHRIQGFYAVAVEMFTGGLRGTVFNDALKALEVISTPSIVDAMVGVYRMHQPTLTLLPDAARCLEWAAAESFNLALLTDGYLAVQQNKVKALRIHDCFQCIVYTDELGREYWKPNVAGFRRIMEALPGQPSGFVYVGDNPRKDFIGPRALGWRSIRIRRPEGEHSSFVPSNAEAADLEISSLDLLRATIAPARSSSSYSL